MELNNSVFSSGRNCIPHQLNQSLSSLPTVLQAPQLLLQQSLSLTENYHEFSQGLLQQQLQSSMFSVNSTTQRHARQYLKDITSRDYDSNVLLQLFHREKAMSMQIMNQDFYNWIDHEQRIMLQRQQALGGTTIRSVDEWNMAIIEFENQLCTQLSWNIDMVTANEFLVFFIDYHFQHITDLDSTSFDSDILACYIRYEWSNVTIALGCLAHQLRMLLNGSDYVDYLHFLIEKYAEESPMEFQKPLIQQVTQFLKIEENPSLSCSNNNSNNSFSNENNNSSHREDQLSPHHQEGNLHEKDEANNNQNQNQDDQLSLNDICMEAASEDLDDLLGAMSCEVTNSFTKSNTNMISNQTRNHSLSINNNSNNNTTTMFNGKSQTNNNNNNMSNQYLNTISAAVEEETSNNSSSSVDQARTIRKCSTASTITTFSSCTAQFQYSNIKGWMSPNKKRSSSEVLLSASGGSGSCSTLPSLMQLQSMNGNNMSQCSTEYDLPTELKRKAFISSSQLFSSSSSVTTTATTTIGTNSIGNMSMRGTSLSTQNLSTYKEDARNNVTEEDEDEIEENHDQIEFQFICNKDSNKHSRSKEKLSNNERCQDQYSCCCCINCSSFESSIVKDDQIYSPPSRLSLYQNRQRKKASTKEFSPILETEIRKRRKTVATTQATTNICKSSSNCSLRTAPTTTVSSSSSLPSLFRIHSHNPTTSESTIP